MSEELAYATVGAVAGFIVLMVGSLGFMGMFPMNETLSFVLMGIGLVLVLGALLLMTMKPKIFENGGANMGFMDKLKGLFKSKKKEGAESAAAPAGKKAAAASAAPKFTAEGKVGKSLNYAAEKIAAKVEAGKMTDKRAAMFYAQLQGVEAEEAAEDVKLIEISQILGQAVSE